MSSRLSDVRKPTFLMLAALAMALAVACEDGLQPVPFQGVSGAVTYISDPDPDSTDWVRLAVYRELPQTEVGLLGFVAFSDTLRTEGPGNLYAVGLDPGTYEFLVVVWKERGNENLLTALRAAGWYTAGGGAFDPPASYTVEPDSETVEINVIADFANMLTIGEVLDSIQ